LGKAVLAFCVLCLVGCSAFFEQPSKTSLYEDGTIIFLENSQPVVEWKTDSSLSHVALIFNLDGQPYVYEAVRPVVRKIPLRNWIEEKRHELQRIPDLKVWTCHPSQPYTPQQVQAMLQYLNAQIGRDYAVTSFVTGPRHTIHCCELASNAFNAAGLNYSTQPWRMTPVDIWRKTGPKYSLVLQSD